MYRILREIRFSYGHRLLDYEGKCAHLHGHNARLWVELSSEKLNAQGMVMDFYEIRKTVGSWIDEAIDHKMLLWDRDPLIPVLQKAGEPVVVMGENPTAEALVKWIFSEIRRMRLPVYKVTLWETETSAATYHE